jgi:Flp pilus assembly protein TadG
MNKYNNCYGVTLVQASLVLPILVLSVMLFIDVGLVVFDRASISAGLANAVKELSLDTRIDQDPTNGNPLLKDSLSSKDLVLFENREQAIKH